MSAESETITPETGANMESRTRLLQLCEDAIAAQRRIIAHDGALQAHQLSLHSLEQQKTMLEQELAEILDMASQ